MTDDKDDDLERAAKELAQGMVDTLRSPDPERVARRAAFEVEKEREDRAALESFYRATGQAAPEGAPIARARSIHEMHFFASLEPCPTCGTHIDGQQLRLAGAGEGWALTGACPRCGTPRGFTFLTQGDPLTAPTPRDELGGPQPSEILSPGRWIAEVDRLLPQVRPDPTQLGLEAWKVNRDTNKRLLVTLNELLKFVPAGAAEIPDDRLDADERADRSARPERYQRVWIEEQRADAIERRARNVADLRRVEQLERGGKSAGRAVELDRTTLRAHQKWIEAGQRGKGQLILVGTRANGAKLASADLSGASLEDVDLGDANLGYATLDRAQLRAVRFEGARLSSASFRGALIDGGSFRTAQLPLAQFDEATIDGTMFDKANLDRTQWRGARVARTSFAAAAFGNADLAGASFVHCAFRGATFAPLSRRPASSTRGARFEDCDLRGTQWEGRDLAGAVFVRCRFDGIVGRPLSVDGIVIEDPDLGSTGDASDPSFSDDILKLWGRP